MENKPSESADDLIKRLEYHWFRPWEEIETRKKLLLSAGKPEIKLLAKSPLPTLYGDWTYLIFGDYASGETHEVLIYGDLDSNSLGDGDNLILRVHSACDSSELFHGVNCECREELDEAMRFIQKKGKGLIIYLIQEGGGAGLKVKVDVYKNLFEWKSKKIQLTLDPETGESSSAFRIYQKLGYKSENRSLSAAVAILKELGIKSVRLLTNNPKKISDLVEGGIKTEPLGIHVKPTNPIMARLLKAKAEELGHNINKTHLRLKKLKRR